MTFKMDLLQILSITLVVTAAIPLNAQQEYGRTNGTGNWGGMANGWIQTVSQAAA